MNYKKILCFVLSVSMFCGTAYAVNASELVPSTETYSESDDDPADAGTTLSSESESSDSAAADVISGTEDPDQAPADNSSDPDTEGTEEITEIPETETTEEAEIVTSVYTEQSLYSASTAKSIIYKYLTETAGFNSATACGIMANIQSESGYYANNVGDNWNRANNKTDSEYTIGVDSGTYTNFVHDGVGYGLCQWLYYTIKQELLDYANSHGTSIGNLYMQLDFLIDTLNSMGYMKYLTDLPNTSEGAYQAAYNFCKYYEKPGNIESSGSKRGAIAQTLFSEYNPETPSEDADLTVIGTYKVTASSLTVRAGNSTDYSSRGYLSQGTIVDVLEISDNWGKILYNGAYGWISLTYCSLVSDASTVTTTVEATTTTTTENTTTTTETQTLQPDSASSGTLYSITASSLNVRSGPGTSYAVLGTLQKNDQVTVLGSSVNGSSTWYQISFNGKTGYISARYCEAVNTPAVTTTEGAVTTTEKTTTSTTEQPVSTTSEQTAVTTETASLGVYKVTASSLTVRQGPSSKYASLGVLANGTQVTILEQDGNWGKINYNGQTGYIYMSYVQKISTETVTTTEEKSTTSTTETTTTTTEAATTTTTGAADSAGSIYKATTTLNVRSGAGTSYSILGVLTANQEITVYEIVTNSSGSWARFSFNGQTAYSSAKYLTYVGEASSHTCTYDSGVVVKPATCIDTGIITYTCTVCGETKEEILPLDPANHTGNTLITNSVESTYDNTGYTGDTCCADCGAVLEKGETIPILQFAITRQPVSVVVAKEGYYATFTVEATGEGLTYAWYWKMPSDSAYKLSSVTSNTYHYAVTASRNGRQVYCVITDKNGDQLTTNVVTMSYN